MAKSKGLSTIDMMSMSPPVRHIARIMLKARRLSYDDLAKEMKKLPSSRHLSKKELDATLEEMVKDGWITKDKTKEGIFYDVQVARKEGTDTKKAPRNVRTSSTNTVKNLWDALEDVPDKKKKASSKKDDDDSKPDPLSKLLF